MTDKLPPNLLKLFAPRPQLPYLRPVDKDIDRITGRNVDAVGPIIAQLREAKTASLFSAAADSDAMEEGEEPTYTHVEEIKRQIRREERKNLKSEQFKIAKETCAYIVYCD
jgi:U1 small nuclear ribonucleoprotein 70kDa